MGIKSAGYGAAGMGLCGAAIIPGSLGAGFIAVGRKLLDVSGWLSDKGNKYRLYSQGLSALEKGDIKADDVNKLVSEKQMSYFDAVIAVVTGAGVVADKKEDAGKADSEVDDDADAAAQTKIVVEDDQEERNPDAQVLAAALC